MKFRKSQRTSFSTSAESVFPALLKRSGNYLDGMLGFEVGFPDWIENEIPNGLVNCKFKSLFSIKEVNFLIQTCVMPDYVTMKVQNGLFAGAVWSI